MRLTYVPQIVCASPSVLLNAKLMPTKSKRAQQIYVYYQHLRLDIGTETTIKNSLSLSHSHTRSKRAIILICQYFTMVFLRDLLIKFGNTHYDRIHTAHVKHI